MDNTVFKYAANTGHQTILSNVKPYCQYLLSDYTQYLLSSYITRNNRRLFNYIISIPAPIDFRSREKKPPTTKRDTNLRDYFSSDGHVMFILSIAAYSRKKLECEYVSLVPSQAPWARMEGFASGTVVPSDEHIWSPKTLLTTCATCCLKAVMWVPFRNVYAGGSKGNGILRP